MPDEALPRTAIPAEAEASSPEESAERRAVRAVPAWLISLAIHGVLLLIFSAVILYQQIEEQEAPPVHPVAIDAPPPKPPERVERDVKPSDVAIDVEAPEADHPGPVSQLDVPLDNDARMTEEETDSDVAKGREEAIADGETGGQGAFMAIGVGGGSSGMFGSRTGGGKKRALVRFGGSKGSENAVDAALRWFKKHQGPDGAWKVAGYQANCADAGAKCDPGTKHTGPEGDIACTGYAILCYLGAGYDHRTPSKYKATVKKAIDWLVAQQSRDGSWTGGSAMYAHGVATMAIAEAYAMSNDPALRDPAQKGLTYIVDHQTDDPALAKGDPYGGLGWDYGGKNPARNDSSVTGWQVMALKSGRAAGLDVKNGIEGAKRWLDKVWKANNPNWRQLTDPYKDESVFSYAWNPTTNTPDGHRNMAPVGALCAVFLGHHQGDMLLESLCNFIAKHQTPTGYPTNLYYLYYDTLAIFQAGGPRWEAWNLKVRDLLVNAQRKDAGCFDGSWDPANVDFGVGRLLSTAYCCLSLEVYYRYVQVAKEAETAAKGNAPAKR